MANIEVLGVYKLEVTNEVFQAQLPMYGDEEQCRDHFSFVVLIEVIVTDIDERFDIGHFRQPRLVKGSEQVAYDEALLSLDGEEVIARDIFCLRGRGNGPHRLAFYLHYYDPKLPLKWTYGEVRCPLVTDMPVRLQMLVPYRPCD
jgi:hypothetical protein